MVSYSSICVCHGCTSRPTGTWSPLLENLESVKGGGRNGEEGFVARFARKLGQNLLKCFNNFTDLLVNSKSDENKLKA